MATLRHNLANLVSVPLTMGSFFVKKLFFRKSFHFSGIQRFSPGVVVDMDSRSRITVGNRVSAHSRCRIIALHGGKLTIGSGTGFNVGCIVICRKQITIGRNVSFGPNVMIYDHDHIMNAEQGVKGADYRYGEIEIGDNCWIGAGSMILRDTRIGKNCVIAAGSVVKGEIPDNTVLIQKRNSTYKGIE